jgi:hypothetical protein
MASRNFPPGPVPSRLATKTHSPRRSARLSCRPAARPSLQAECARPSPRHTDRCVAVKRCCGTQPDWPPCGTTCRYNIIPQKKAAACVPCGHWDRSVERGPDAVTITSFAGAAPGIFPVLRAATNIRTAPVHAGMLLLDLDCGQIQRAAHGKWIWILIICIPNRRLGYVYLYLDFSCLNFPFDALVPWSCIWIPIA